VVVTITDDRCCATAKRPVRRRPDDEHAQIFLDVVEAVLHVRGDEYQASRLDGAVLTGGADRARLLIT